MKLKSIALAVATVSALASTTGAFAQAKEQFIPVLSYRTGAYAPNGAPWANGFVDYLKLVNARGGINGVKLTFEECETGYDTARSVECYERLKGKGASFVQPLSTGATFAITEKAPEGISLLHLVSHRPGDAAPTDHGPVAIRNPDYTAFTDDQGKPLPFHGGLATMADGAVTTRHVILGVCEGLDKHVYILALVVLGAGGLLLLRELLRSPGASPARP